MSNSNPRRKGDTEAFIANRKLFNDLRFWAYSQFKNYHGGDIAAWQDACVKEAKARNEAQTFQLPESEVQRVATNVAAWIWNNFTGRKAAVEASEGAAE